MNWQSSNDRSSNDYSVPTTNLNRSSLFFPRVILRVGTNPVREIYFSGLVTACLVTVAESVNQGAGPVLRSFEVHLIACLGQSGNDQHCGTDR
jgi:hypothetical protein